MRSSLRFVLSAVLAFTPLAVRAQTETLNYIGSPYTSLEVSGNVANAIAENPLTTTGQIVLSSPLGDNLNSASVTPLSWSFSGLYLDSNGPVSYENDNYANFVFSTDASGYLTTWGINITAGVFEGTNAPSGTMISIGNSGDSLYSFISMPGCDAPPGVSVPCYDISESNDAPGSWSYSVARAPEFNAGSAASALTLLLGTLLILRGRRVAAR